MVQLSGRNLAAMDYGWSSDPYYEVFFVPAAGKRSKLRQSEVVMTNLNPDWQPQILYVQHIICKERKEPSHVFSHILCLSYWQEL